MVLQFRPKKLRSTRREAGAPASLFLGQTQIPIPNLTAPSAVLIGPSWLDLRLPGDVHEQRTKIVLGS